MFKIIVLNFEKAICTYSICFNIQHIGDTVFFLSVQEKDWCKLTCKADSSPSHFYRLNIKVIDGTKCRPDHNDICVDGKCRVSICSPIFLAT